MKTQIKTSLQGAPLVASVAGRLIHKDARWDYGEDRYQLLGAIDGRVFFVVYAIRE